MAAPVVPPLTPMLAKVSETIPAGPGWVYEPKWDGLRTLVFRTGDEIRIMSRQDRPLGRYFPELQRVLPAALPDACVVDGEIVLATEEGLDFDLLLQRIHPAASRVDMLAAETPATVVLFDMLAIGDTDLRATPLRERRARLVGSVRFDEAGGDGPVPPGGPRVLLCPQTDDPDVARDWFVELEAHGLDGIIAKRDEGPYMPGERVMMKIKHRRSADCVVIGYRAAKGSVEGVGSLLLGLYEGDVLHYVGHTSSFKAAERRELVQRLRPYVRETGVEGGRAPGAQSRWSQGRDSDWIPLEPELVCEVSFEHLQAGRFRHAARFLRWRTDREPRSCSYDQFRTRRG